VVQTPVINPPKERPNSASAELIELKSLLRQDARAKSV